MKKANLFEVSTTAISGGILMSVVYPPYAIYGIGLAIYGGFIGIQCIRGASKFERLFKNLGLGINEEFPIFKDKKHTDNSTIYTFTLPTGLCSDDFLKYQNEIEQYLGREVDIKYTYKEIQIEEFKNEFKHYYEYEPIDIKGDVPILIGYNRKGEEVTCDLSNGEPHMLIAGETGSGKSTALRSLITNLILKSNVKLHLVDLKSGAEFNVFRKSSKVETFSRTIAECLKVLETLSYEVDRRYNLFFEKDVKDIKEYNKKFINDRLDYLVLIIDEFADLQYNSKCKDYLNEFCRKARAVGVHCIFATQRPDKEVLSGAIKVNISNILGLKTLNELNSRIIFDEGGLEKLKGKGHGLFKRGYITEIQSPYLDVDKAKDLIKHTFVDKTIKKEKIENIDYSSLEVFQ